MVIFVLALCPLPRRLRGRGDDCVVPQQQQQQQDIIVRLPSEGASPAAHEARTRIWLLDVVIKFIHPPDRPTEHPFVAPSFSLRRRSEEKAGI